MTATTISDLALADLVLRSYEEPEEFGLFRVKCEVDPTTGAHLIGFSGTVDVVDWMSNFRAWMARTPAFPGRYHAGFAGTWSMIATTIAGMLHRERLRSTEDAWHVAGHSRGGVIAVMTAIMIKWSYPEADVNLVTFATPRFGDRAAVHHVAKLLPRARHYRLNYDPIVTRPGWSPLWPYADPRGIVHLPRPDAPQRLGYLNWKDIPIIRRHDLARYRAELLAEANA